MSVTRIFRRRAGLVRRGANDATALVQNPLLEKRFEPEKIDARRLFIDRYPSIKSALECHREQGVLIFAFDESDTAIGHVWLRASLDKTRSMTIGRHSMCSLVLPTEKKEISLRHLVVLVRAISHDEVRVRVIDLHTKIAFGDEEGRVLQAVAAEGPIFLSVGSVRLVMLPTMMDDLIADSAEDAYSCLPDRVLLDERQGTVGEVNRRVDVLPEMFAPGATIIRSKLGPLAAAGELCKPDETPRGDLTVRAGGGPVRRPVGETALERGILIGRYARCDVGATHDEESRLSRVHLLLVADGEDVIAVDTASTNGSFQAQRSIQLERLTDGLVLDLAGELDLIWHH